MRCRAARSETARCASGARLAETIRHYEFFGRTAADANESFRKHLLVAKDFSGARKEFAGQADWHIEWRTCVEPVPSGCRIAGVTSIAHVAYTLPQWAQLERAPAGLRVKWERYAGNLLAHEKGHGRIALKVAQMIEDEVVGLVHADGCIEANADAARRIDAVVKRGVELQNAYDRATNHGGSQGAVFPF